jgi:hypothetical protein
MENLRQDGLYVGLDPTGQSIQAPERITNVEYDLHHTEYVALSAAAQKLIPLDLDQEKFELYRSLLAPVLASLARTPGASASGTQGVAPNS